MKQKLFTLLLAVAGIGMLPLLAHALNNPIGADGRYIVKYDCTAGTFTSSNDMEVDETFVFAIDVTGTWLENWLNESSTYNGAARGIAVNAWTNYGRLKNDTERLMQINGNIWGMTCNFAQLLGNSIEAQKATMPDSVVYVFAQFFGFEYTADNIGAGWWMWGDQEPYITQADGSDCLFAFAPYTGTKTSPELLVSDHPDGYIYGIEQVGYTAPCLIPLYFLTVNADEGGVIKSGVNGKHLENEQVTIEAIPDYGYHFKQWSDGNTDNPRTIVITQDTTLTAEFAVDRSGRCGNYLALIWTYDPTAKTLIISGEGAFEQNTQCGVEARQEMTTLIIEEGVTSIGSYAFSDCSGLTSVTIPNSVTSIGYDAFFNCSGLPIIDNVRYADSYLVEAVDKTLSSHTIKDGTRFIGEYAFLGCTGLTSIEIPNSVTSIGKDAFDYCTALTSVIWNAKNCSNSGDFGSQVESFVFGNEVETIPGHCCYGMNKLTSVTIPNSVTSIGDRAFYGCSGLTSVAAPAAFFDIPEGNWPYYTKILNHVTVNDGELTENALLFINRSYKTLQTLDVSRVTNTEFADEAFKGYYNLQQLVLPAGLQKVSYMMVAGCKNLQSIDIPASVEEIEQSAFEDCRSLKSITFGGSPAGAPGRLNAPAASANQLRKIGNWAFYNAHELQNLVIPEGVTEIGDGAFYGCTYLEEMVLPSSVQTIGDNTFALCAKLKKITVNSVTPPSIQAKTFFDVKRQIPVYVPDEAVSAYEADTYWQEFDIQGASNMPTGIDNVSSSLQGGDRGRLILHNGQIFILRGEKTYTLQGAEVK